MSRGAVRSVVIHHDTDTARRIRGSSNPDAGLVAASVPADMRRGYELTWELLEGLGKVRDITGAGKLVGLNWELLAAWSLARGIEHFIIVDAQWLPRPVLEDVIGLCAVTQTTLWLVAQQPVDDEYVEALADWPTEPAKLIELEVVLTTPRRSGPRAPEPFPTVPADNFTSFRSEACRRLTPDAFEIVDARFRSAFARALAWIDERRGEAVDELSLLAHIRSELHTCVSADEMLTVLRGVQVAAFRRGWLLSFDLPRLVATVERASEAAVRSPLTWRRLEAYREPYRGAACALVACELGLETLGRVRLEEVVDGGRVVRIAEPDGVRAVELPAGANLFLRAQVIYRRIQGAGPGDLLFATEQGPIPAKRLADSVRAPVTELGVPIYSQIVDRVTLDPKRWAQRWGLAVQAL